MTFHRSAAAIVVLVWLAALAVATTALAQEVQQGGFVPLSDANFNDLFGIETTQQGDITRFFNRAFSIALSVGAILAVLRIAYAGYLYMGTDLWGDKGKAKEMLGDIALGILLLLSVYLILNQINPDILRLDILRNVKDPSTQLQQENVPQDVTQLLPM